jgi:hypothetical protein
VLSCLIDAAISGILLLNDGSCLIGLFLDRSFIIERVIFSASSLNDGLDRQGARGPTLYILMAVIVKTCAAVVIA